jgi:phage gp36-like protein
MAIRLAVSSVVGIALLTSLAHAQSVEAIVARYNDDPALTITVSDEVSANVDVAGAFCEAADDASEQVQVYVGAGFAGAHQYLLSVNETTAAANIKLTVCTCERTPGQILNSFANGIGGLERDVCSSAWRGDAGGSSPNVFNINTRGGGDGVSRN